MNNVPPTERLMEITGYFRSPCAIDIGIKFTREKWEILRKNKSLVKKFSHKMCGLCNSLDPESGDRLIYNECKPCPLRGESPTGKGCITGKHSVKEVALRECTADDWINRMNEELRKWEETHEPNCIT